jgi:hypothetical protein
MKQLRNRRFFGDNPSGEKIYLSAGEQTRRRDSAVASMRIP